MVMFSGVCRLSAQWPISVWKVSLEMERGRYWRRKTCSWNHTSHGFCQDPAAVWRNHKVSLNFRDTSGSHIQLNMSSSPWMIQFSRIIYLSFAKLSFVPLWLLRAGRYDSKMLCWCLREASMLLTIFITRPNTVGPRRLSQMAVGSSCLQENKCFCLLWFPISHPCLHASGSRPAQSAAWRCRVCHPETSYPSSLPAGEKHGGSIITVSAGVVGAKPVDFDSIMCYKISMVDK